MPENTAENTAAVVRPGASTAPAASAPTTDTAPLPPHIERLIRPVAVATAVVATIATGFVYDVGTALLVLAGSVIVLIVSLFWTSVRTLAGDTPLTIDQAIELAAPSAAEEQKRAVLQALKDLEYERSVGKVSDADYQELLARYRTEAKRLLRAADEEMAPLRARAEAFLEGQSRGGPPRNRRVAPRDATSSDRKAADSAATDVSTHTNGEPVAREPIAAGARACSSCRIPNDLDAVFCKKCGARLEGGRIESSSTASADNADERA